MRSKSSSKRKCSCNQNHKKCSKVQICWSSTQVRFSGQNQSRLIKTKLTSHESTIFIQKLFAQKPSKTNKLLSYLYKNFKTLISKRSLKPKHCCTTMNTWGVWSRLIEKWLKKSSVTKKNNCKTKKKGGITTIIQSNWDQKRCHILWKKEDKNFWANRLQMQVIKLSLARII